MRHSFIIAMTLLSSAAAQAADKPIPQDIARMEKRYRDRLEWNRQAFAVAYDKVGKKDPRWDGPARDALELAARMFTPQVDPVISMDDVHVMAGKALSAGCDDPMILYLFARTSFGRFFPKQPELNRRLQAAADAMTASGYSPYRRAVAVRVAAEQKGLKVGLTPDEQREVVRDLGAILDLLPKSVTEEPRNENWEDGWYVLNNDVIALHRRLGSDYKAAFDRVDARLAKVPGIEALRLTVKGNFFSKWGWEARTQALASQVTEEQFRTFETRLRQARSASNDAWAKKPDEPHVADLMLSIEKSIGGGDRASMETWFERAMKANGNDFEACWSKLDWLDPKWYGGDSWDDLMAFGKACRATGNWRAGITLLAADAHLRYCIALDPKERAVYVKRDDVWSDIQSVYDEYLKHFPHDHVQRSKYASLCYTFAHIPLAHAQFQILGDNLTTWATSPSIRLEVLKRFRDQAVQQVAGKPRPDANAANKADRAPNP